MVILIVVVCLVVHVLRVQKREASSLIRTKHVHHLVQVRRFVSTSFVSNFRAFYIVMLWLFTLNGVVLRSLERLFDPDEGCRFYEGVLVA